MNTNVRNLPERLSHWSIIGIVVALAAALALAAVLPDTKSLTSARAAWLNRGTESGEVVMTSPLSVSNARVRDAFRDPYNRPLSRDEIVVLIDEEAPGADERTRKYFWGEIYRSYVIQPNKLPMLSKYGSLGSSACEDFASMDSERTRVNMLVGVFKCRVWYELGRHGVEWPTVLRQWMVDRKVFARTGKPRSGTDKSGNPAEFWIFPPPLDKAERAKALAGEQNDLESFAYYMRRGTDWRANGSARAYCREQGKLVQFPTRTGPNAAEDEPDDDNDPIEDGASPNAGEDHPGDDDPTTDGGGHEDA